jgi:predicted permease
MSREDVRRWNTVEFLESVLRDLRYAFRSSRKRPGFVAVGLLTLALGIGATTVMFTVINGVLLKPLSYPAPDQLVTVHENMEKYGDLWFSYPDFLDCQQQSHSLALAAWTHGGGMVTRPGEAEYVDSRQISPELFSVLGITLVRGRSFLPEENQPGTTPVAIISQNMWQRRFGGRPDVVGSWLTFGGQPYTITGIAPAGFQLEGEPDVFTPLGQSTEPRRQNRKANFLHVLARLRPGVALTTAQVELAQIGRNLAQEYPASNAGRSFMVEPLRQELVASVSSTLWLLLGAVGLLLLIACANVASLLLSRAVSREREFAVLVALGAGRGRLVQQCLTESSLLGLVGGTLGVLLAAAAIRPFLLLWPGSLPRAEEVHLDWHVLLFALAVSLFSALLFGLAPALRAPARDVEPALRAGARTISRHSHRLHSAFVVSQIALAVLLLVSAGMLGRTVLRLSSLDPGLDVKNVLVARLAFAPNSLTDAEQTRSAWRQLLDNAREVPGAQSAALTDIVPMREGLDEVGYWTTEAPPPPDQMPFALASNVTPDYLKVMGISLRQGRFFTDDDHLGNNPVVVIDEVLARHTFPGQDPIGKRLWLQDIGPAQVIGVVEHVRHWGLAHDDQAQVRAQVYWPLAFLPDRLTPIFSSFLSLTVRTNVAPLNIVEPLRQKLRGTTGEPVLYQIRTMEQLASASLARERFLVLLFGVLAGLALLLACVGIYGVMAYLTDQRIPEIGVRMALGANSRNIMQLVLKHSLGMIVLGAGLGILAALATGRLLLHLVDGMRPMQPLTLTVMIGILFAAALLASFVPARRASRLDAAQALRSE